MGLLGADASEVAAGFEKRLEALEVCLDESPNKDGAVDEAGCEVAGVDADGPAEEADPGPANENKGFCSELEAFRAGVVAAVDSAGFEAAPKPKLGLAPPPPKRPPADVDVADDGAELVAGLPKLNVADFCVSSAGFAAPNRPPPPVAFVPPVLAPRVEPDGGGPAGVVEALPKLKRLLVPVVAGVVDPNRDAPDAEVDGAPALSGVVNPANAGFEASPV